MKLSDPEFVKRLETLALLARRVLSGSLRSDRKTLKRGSGTTFADYAEYKLGDDYRNIDWNIYARMESMVVKLFELEEDASVYVLLDLSPSMTPKLDFAKKLAAALGYIALHRHDRLSIYGFSDSLRPLLESSHGRAKIFPMLDALERAETFGAGTGLTECVRQFQIRQRRPGICVLVSDFLSPDGLGPALDCLLWARNDVHCIQTLDKDEVRCLERGDMELQCVESGALRRVTVGAAEAKRFEEAFVSWNEGLKSVCAKKGAGFSSSFSEIPFEDVVQGILRRGGLLS